jgi:hypothetical protein
LTIESDDEVRVVKSHKDKAWDSMRDSIKRLRAAIKINDWSAILDEFKNTNKIIDKSKMLIIKNGLPKFYVKILVDLEDFLTETLKDKDGIKKMKKETAKSFNAMKLTLRKHNKDYQDEMTACRTNPTDYVEASSSESESSDEDSDSDSDSDSSEEPVKKPAAKPSAAAAKPAPKPAAAAKPAPKVSSSLHSNPPSLTLCRRRLIPLLMILTPMSLTPMKILTRMRPVMLEVRIRGPPRVTRMTMPLRGAATRATQERS